MKTFEEIVDALKSQANPELIPDMIKPVCIVSGKPYDMGYQLGLELGQLSVNQTLILAARIRAMRPDTARRCSSSSWILGSICFRILSK